MPASAVSAMNEYDHTIASSVSAVVPPLMAVSISAFKANSIFFRIANRLFISCSPGNDRPLVAGLRGIVSNISLA